MRHSRETHSIYNEHISHIASFSHGTLSHRPAHFHASPKFETAWRKRKNCTWNQKSNKLNKFWSEWLSIFHIDFPEIRLIPRFLNKTTFGKESAKVTSRHRCHAQWKTRLWTVWCLRFHPENYLKCSWKWKIIQFCWLPATISRDQTNYSTHFWKNKKGLAHVWLKRWTVQRKLFETKKSVHLPGRTDWLPHQEKHQGHQLQGESWTPIWGPKIHPNRRGLLEPLVFGALPEAQALPTFRSIRLRL